MPPEGQSANAKNPPRPATPQRAARTPPPAPRPLNNSPPPILAGLRNLITVNPAPRFYLLHFSTSPSSITRTPGACPCVVC